MADAYEKLLEDSIDVAADPAAVWTLVTDVPRMAKWSPQVVRSTVKGGVVRKGAKFSNINRHKLLVWPTKGKVVRFTPPTEQNAGDFAFRIAENKTIWSFELAPLPDGGTRVTQRRETPDGISDLSLMLTKRILGGQERFTAGLRSGMRQTLERMKEVLER